MTRIRKIPTLLSDKDIYESLDSALWALGSHVHDLVISTIESRGIQFRPDAIDQKLVDKVLVEFFGIGSAAIIDLARSRLYSKLSVGFDESLISDPVEKIKMWIEVNCNQRQTLA